MKKQFFTRAVRLALAVALVTPTLSQADGELDTGFDPNANDDVYTIVKQSDGKILVGGNFTSIGGQTRNYIARLNANGTLDTSFNPNADGRVRTIALQSDGKILVGGSFNNIGGAARGKLARLNTNGTIDSSFDNASGFVHPSAPTAVFDILIQGTGKIMVAGSFNGISGQSREGIARFETDGTFDTSFTTGANDAVSALAEQADGKIVVVGLFSSLAGQSRNFIGRIDANGTLDTGFDPNSDGWTYSVAVQTDGKILVGGDFANIAGTARNRLARLNTNGTLDTGFAPEPNLGVDAITIQADGKILIGGFFTGVDSQLRKNLGRLNTNGTLDTTFVSNANNRVRAILLQDDENAIVGGSFDEIGVPLDTFNFDGTPRNYIARVGSSTTPGTSGQAPSVKLKGKKTIRTTRNKLTIRGIATDPDNDIVSVLVKDSRPRGKKKFRSARGLTNWNYKVPLRKGSNRIKIFARDSTGRSSRVVKLKIIVRK